MATEQHTTHRLLTVPEVADRLRLSRGTVYKLIRTGVIPAVQLGGNGSSLRVRTDELDGFLYREAPE